MSTCYCYVCWRRPRALIYGKSLEAWSGAGASELLEFLHEEMGLELHATIAVPPLAQPSQPVPVAVAPPSASASSSLAGARPRVPKATNVSDGAAAGAGASPSRSQSGGGTPGSPAAGPLAALPAFVHNHGLLPLAELHALYRSVVVCLSVINVMLPSSREPADSYIIFIGNTRFCWLS